MSGLWGESQYLRSSRVCEKKEREMGKEILRFITRKWFSNNCSHLVAFVIHSITIVI